MRRCIAVLAAAVALSACSSGGEADRPGSPEVYERIAGLEDCAALQQEFDTAEANGGETGTAYMKAADERMQELGCY